MVVADSGDTNQQEKHNTLFTTHSQHAGTHQLTFQPAVKGRHDPPNSQVRKKINKSLFSRSLPTLAESNSTLTHVALNIIIRVITC